VALNAYLTQVRQLLKDPNGNTYNSTDLTAYINEARGELATTAECVRLLYQFNDASTFTTTGNTAIGVAAITNLLSTTNIQVGDLVTLAGTIDVVCQVTAIPPTTPAGQVNITVPALANSAGATFSFTHLFKTVVGQETYSFPQSAWPSQGYLRVVQVKSISVNWGGVFGSNNLQLEKASFTNYNAILGYYGKNLLAQPACWVQYGTTFKLRPIPSAAYPMQLDTICEPIDLATDTDPEAIPYPFTNAIKYYAAYLAFLSSQRDKDAENMMKRYERSHGNSRASVARSIVPNVYR
jgi:hypothetical protein